MKLRLVGNVTIPHRPMSIGGLLGWARDVNQCLVELRDRIISGPPASGRGGGSAATGPFCRTYIDGDEWKLMGGTVTSGTGNVTTGDITLGDTDPLPANGTHVWLVCSGTALVIDGLLLLQFDLATATPASGLVLPTPNTIPTAAAPSGVLYVSLGSWSNGVFVPSGCGNIGISHCPGSLTAFRL